MFKNAKLAAMGLTGLVALTLVSSGAQADPNRNNNYRDVAALGAVVAGIGIANHNATEAVLGSAGAIYAISQVQPSCGDQQASFWNGTPQRDNRDQDNRDRNNDQNRDQGGRKDQNQFKNGSDNHDRR